MSSNRLFGWVPATAAWVRAGSACDWSRWGGLGRVPRVKWDWSTMTGAGGASVGTKVTGVADCTVSVD
jgi:hypothetical protein